ncbi:MAG: class B sortase [Lachnospiraceae bacterium]|nr:class B sortase [Lachnospiraceae bacterium]
MGDRSGRNNAENHTPKGMIIAIAAVSLLVLVLVCAIVYMRMHGYGEADTQSAGNGSAGGSQSSISAIGESQSSISDTGEEIEDALDAMEKASAAIPARPEGWYGSFESSGDKNVDADLDSYIAICPDIYAFIDIPGTDIAYPVVYCEDAADPFYFTHSIDGRESAKGSIITDSMNSRDFSDPVTLIYGQSPDDGSMFGGLHRFRDAKFFEEHDRIDIVLTDAQLSYRIYACYIGSSDHILASNDFNDPVSFAGFFDSIGEVRDLSMNIRPDAKPQLGDHVIMLVTHCGDESKRLFVCAVLDEVRY